MEQGSLGTLAFYFGGASLIAAVVLVPLAIHAWRTLARLPLGRSAFLSGGAAVGVFVSALIRDGGRTASYAHPTDAPAVLGEALGDIAYGVAILALVSLPLLHGIALVAAARTRFEANSR